MDKIDNVGICAVFGKFYIQKIDGLPVFTKENLNDAVSIIENNTIGNSAGNLLGQLHHIDKDGTAIVQITGVARFKYHKKAKELIPILGFFVGCYDGKVHHTLNGRGLVLAVYEDDCDVLLG